MNVKDATKNAGVVEARQGAAAPALESPSLVESVAVAAAAAEPQSAIAPVVRTSAAATAAAFVHVRNIRRSQRETMARRNAKERMERALKLIAREPGTAVAGVPLSAPVENAFPKMAEYAVPFWVKYTFITAKTEPMLRSNLTDFGALPSDDLRMRWHTYMYVMEMALLLRYRDYDMESIFIPKGKLMSLRFDHLPVSSSQRPQVNVGDTVHVWPLIRTPAQRKCSAYFVGVIHSIAADRSELLIGFDANFCQAYARKSCRVEFHHARYNFRCEHHKINNVAEDALPLTPENDLWATVIKVCNKKLPLMPAE